ncbi:MAG: WYL domain-containing protein [Actinomycetaceae bacterium]|nr:WYL domain-containing protein [Actinomycetaceae bacterium]
MSGRRPKKDYMQQLSLALKSITDSHRGVTKKQLMQLIGLDIANASDDKQLHRLIERLQGLGYPVTYDPNSERYALDKKRIFDIEASSTDLTLLKTAIRQAPRRSTQTALVLESALAKLHATGSSERHDPNVAADIPDEDLLLLVVSSIEKKKRVRFAYRGAQSGEPAWRIFDPYLVFSRDRVFYVCGRACPDTEIEEGDVCPPEEWQWRTYRISRIDSSTYEEIGSRSERFSPQDAHEKVSTFFEAHDVTLAVRPGKAQALRSIAEQAGEPHSLCPPGWDCYRIARIDRRFLFERLMTYGLDVQLLAPAGLREEWAGRLRHLATVGVSR